MNKTPRVPTERQVTAIQKGCISREKVPGVFWAQCDKFRNKKNNCKIKNFTIQIAVKCDKRDVFPKHVFNCVGGIKFLLKCNYKIKNYQFTLNPMQTNKVYLFGS